MLIATKPFSHAPSLMTSAFPYRLPKVVRHNGQVAYARAWNKRPATSGFFNCMAGTCFSHSGVDKNDFYLKNSVWEGQ